MTAAIEFSRGAAQMPPAGLTRRLGAFALDMAAAVVLLQLIAPPIYMASGGRAQLLNAPYGGWRCSALNAAAPELTRAVGPRLCEKTLFGYPFASSVTQGAAGAERRQAGPVDAFGRPVAPLDLGWLLAPLFVAVRLWFEAFGMRTPGRVLFRQGLFAADGGAVSVEALARRYGALIGPFLVVAMLAGAAIRLAPAIAGVATGLAAMAIFLFYGAVCVSILRGRAPFHDRLAGTRVVAREP